MTNYVVLFFPSTKDVVDATDELREESGVKIKMERIPRELTGLQDDCNLGIISTDVYRDRIASRLAHPQGRSDPFSYKTFEVDPAAASDGIKPFIKMWDRCRW